MKTPEYVEGPKAQENFERTMTTLFRAPKSKTRKTAKKSSKTATSRKSRNADKD
jgi:hypothetical protein